MSLIDKYNGLEAKDQLTVKRILIGAGCLVGGIVIFRKVRKAIEKANSESDLLNSNAYNVKNFSTGITTSVCATDAEALWRAMKDTGTDTDTISRIVSRYKTADDWKCLISKFGNREYGTVGEPWWGTGTPTPLIGWFKKELSGSLLSSILTTVQNLGITTE